MQKIHDQATFNDMLDAERAIVFFHVDWSVYSVRSRKLVEDFESRTINNAWVVGTQLSFWEIDLSEQSGVIWDAIENWLKPQCNNFETLMSGGGGPIVWCFRGKVADHIYSAEWVRSIFDRTRSVSN